MANIHYFLILCSACSAVLAQDGLTSNKTIERLATEVSKPAIAGQDAAPIGYVKTVSGIAFVVTQGKAARASIGSPLMQGSVLKTGLDSSLGITFNDSTVMSFGPETELKIDEYLYVPTEGKLRFGSHLIRGTLNYVSGVIAKLKPDGVTITTPTGMIGVRGTQFVAKVTPSEPSP